MTSTPNFVFMQLLKAVEDDYSKDKRLSEKSLSMLGFLFDTTALQALDLIDQECITLVQTPSGRELYQVQRRVSDFNICFKYSNYCSCQAFYYQVLKKEQFMCKHKLATKLSSAMGLCKTVLYSDETIALMLAGES